jgi:ketosteroid isomerase-like protein
MSVQAQVLAANKAFYDAFTGRDFRAMDALWAQDLPVLCIHPGWDALRGRVEVMASWKAILSTPSTSAVTCGQATAQVLGDLAFVVCTEDVEGATLVATNIFARENHAWKLVHHQAGPVARRAPPAAKPSPHRMN